MRKGEEEEGIQRLNKKLRAVEFGRKIVGFRGKMRQIGRSEKEQEERKWKERDDGREVERGRKKRLPMRD